MQPDSTPTKTKVTPPTVTQPPSAPVKCRVVEQPDGGLQVSFLIEPLAGMRLKRKAGGMDLARFIYENYLKREVDSWVY